MAQDKGEIVVLVVEDEPLLLLAAKDIIASAGFVAVGSASADEALLLLRNRRFSAIVTDIDLPGEANRFGVAWCAYSLGLAVVVVSGRLTPTSDMLPPGSAFLPKPIEDDVLVEVLRRSLVTARRD